MKRYIYILCLFLFASCKLINPLYNEGKHIETSIEIEDFTQLEVQNVFNIEIIADTETFILYKGGENILKEMTYTSKDQILKLDHKFMNWANSFKIPRLEIHTTYVDTINIYSSGSLVSQNQLSAENLTLNINRGAEAYEVNLKVKCSNFRFFATVAAGGSFDFSGECQTASFDLNGSTNIKALNLISEKTTFIQNSLGNAYVFAKDTIKAGFYNSGNIYYKGKPKNIEVKYGKVNHQKASGKLIPMED